MKVHYINILLFALQLNILVNTFTKPHSTPRHTPPNRTLCECELYAPANYDNDPEMKEVMDNFNKQTQQRFHEYDESMKTTRQKCKDKCDKEIQKIILKDKLEKQMAQHFHTLRTDTQNDAIPTFVCEKSTADKVEKFCLNCGYALGSVAPNVGLIGSLAVNVWKTGALLAAAQKGTEAGIAKTIAELYNKLLLTTLNGRSLTSAISASNFNDINILGPLVQNEYNTLCTISNTNSGNGICFYKMTFEGRETMIPQVLMANTKSVITAANKEVTVITEAEVISNKNCKL
ncbi:rifin PIR protein,putative [Plasmodium sp. DRC-Itaito]|nr:rifin PIR protein,putative [Plasmodium sp. DRC-Itaito]